MIGSRQNPTHLSRAFTFFSYSMPQRSKPQFDGHEWEEVTKSEMLRGLRRLRYVSSFSKWHNGVNRITTTIYRGQHSQVTLASHTLA